MRSTLPATTFLLTVFFFATMTASGEEVPPGRYFAMILANATELEVYSIDPAVKVEKDGFHGYKILGKTTVKKEEAVKELVAAFKKGVEEAEKARQKDYQPRHGLRFKIRDTTIDVIL